MQSKTLAAVLLLAVPALATPQATSVASSDSSSSDSSDDSGSFDSISVPSIPTDYINVLETAVPSSWEYEMENPASQAAVVSAAAEGIYPSWYNDLPASIKVIVTELGGFDYEIAGETGSMPAAVSASSSPASETGSAAATTTASATSDVSSSSKSTAPKSALSTGGAPMITGGAMGAAGLLGLMIAL